MIELRPYQKVVVDAICERKHVLIVAPMGSGKTVATLTATAVLLVREGYKNVIIVAPKRVAENVWSQEAAKYEMGLNVKICKSALDVKLFLCDQAPHHICVASVTRIEEIPDGCWDMAVADESTLFGNKSSKRSKEARRLFKGLKSRVLLSGTPIHGGHEKLFHQLFLLDGGKSCGKTLGEFRERYMRVKYQVNGVVTIWEVDPLKIPRLMQDCKHLIYVVKDHVVLPELLYKNISVRLPRAAMDTYEAFEETSVLQFKMDTGKDAYTDERTLIAFSRTSLGAKLRQFASGCVYADDERKTYKVFHNVKIKALEDLIEVHEGGILVVYQFLHELEELKRAFPEARRLDTEADISDWNAGKVRVALVHPQSVGHGLNLQFGGHVVVWYSPTYDAELYAQVNKRLHRPGQNEVVSVLHLIAERTIDERVLRIVTTKERNANSFING